MVIPQNWNPGGFGGAYNDNVIGVFWKGSNWAIFDQNTAVAMPIGASVNVLVIKQ